MHDAARDFQAQFTVARFDVIRCMPLIRLPGCAGAADLTDAQVHARRRVGGALDALGGLGSPAGGCIWHGVGLQRSIREWAMGRPAGARRAGARDRGGGARDAGRILWAWSSCRRVAEQKEFS
jgi:hypothetical protein